MSYDIYLRGPACSQCGHREEGPDLPNPTYNLSEIFDLAITGEPFPSPEVGEAAVVLFRRQTERPRGLRVLSERRAGDTIVMLEKAILRMSDPALRASFLKLEPPNKWGDFPGAREVMERLLKAAKDYPELIWDIH